MSVASVPAENLSFASEPNANLATASLLYSKVPSKHLTSVRHYKPAVKCCLSTYICNWPSLVPYHRQAQTKLLKHPVQLEIHLLTFAPMRGIYLRLKKVYIYTFKKYSIFFHVNETNFLAIFFCYYPQTLTLNLEKLFFPRYLEHLYFTCGPIF
jgi:hypothetical protein